MPVDPLAEIVTLLQPSISSSKLVEGGGDWKIARPGTGDLFFCVVLKGQCRMVVKDQSPVVLQAGDFLLVPALCDLTAESINASKDCAVTAPIQSGSDRFRIGAHEGPVDVLMRIGHCQFRSPDAELLVSLLPQLVHVREKPRFATLIQLVAEETQAERPAHNLILERLLEVLLLEAFRSSNVAASAPGLARGLADVRLAAALHAVHKHPERAWTAADLAAEASLSRSAFFARFRGAVGLKPMEYVLAWRMALARRLLGLPAIKIDEVAERVGYSSASTFSVAFSRHVGISPSGYVQAHPLKVNGHNNPNDNS